MCHACSGGLGAPRAFVFTHAASTASSALGVSPGALSRPRSPRSAAMAVDSRRVEPAPEQTAQSGQGVASPSAAAAARRAVQWRENGGMCRACPGGLCLLEGRRRRRRWALHVLSVFTRTASTASSAPGVSPAPTALLVTLTLASLIGSFCNSATLRQWGENASVTANHDNDWAHRRTLPNYQTLSSTGLLCAPSLSWFAPLCTRSRSCRRKRGNAPQ